MSSIGAIPEITGFDAIDGRIRLPPEQDAPLTPRVRQLIDAPAFRRLARISQLGLVSLVFPAANHSRFEHSLGAYRIALLYLRRLAHDARFCERVSSRDVEKLIAAVLLHDVGHWPFCHPIEDMKLRGVAAHEAFARRYIAEGEIAETLHDAWGLDPQEVAALVAGKPKTANEQLLSSILSGPIDVDKMDYLARDSLHAGVPYGRNFDQQRLIGGICVNKSGDGLAVTEKGRTAAEMMVFARYVMFSEVYWHHAVRAATAMFQRAFFALSGELDCDRLFRLTEPAMVEQLLHAAKGRRFEPLMMGLFGEKRTLYKRLAEYSYFQNRENYERLARRPYPELAEFAKNFAQAASRRLHRPIGEYEILFDAPPIELEVEFNIDIYYPKEDCYFAFSDVSPVVRTLAVEQFDDYVKRVRVFASPDRIDELRSLGDLTELLDETLTE